MRKDICPRHNVDIKHCGYECLLAAFNGYEVTPWWPVKLHHLGGWYRNGSAWRRPVLLRRSIGFPSWYYTELDPPPTPPNDGVLV